MNRSRLRSLILVFFVAVLVGGGFAFAAPKQARADALGDFIQRMTLGDFIQGLISGLFGGTTRGSDSPYPTPTPTPTCGSSSGGRGMTGFISELLGGGRAPEGDTCPYTTPTPLPTQAAGQVCQTPGEKACIGNTKVECALQPPYASRYVWTDRGQCGDPRFTCVVVDNSWLCLAPSNTPTPTPALVQCEFGGPWGWVQCITTCGVGNCTSDGCSQDPVRTYKCSTPPPPTPTPTQQPNCGGTYCAPPNTCAYLGSTYSCVTPTPTTGPCPNGVCACSFAHLDNCENACGQGNCTQNGCTGDRWKCTNAPTATPTPSKTPVPTRTPTPTIFGNAPCPYTDETTCETACGVENCVYCSSGNWRCYRNVTATPQPTNTPVPLSPTVTVGPGTPTPTPAPSNTPVPVPSATPTTSVAPTSPPGGGGSTPVPTQPPGSSCYYNVKLVSANGAPERSAIQTGTVVDGGCRTGAGTEIVPSYYNQGSSSFDNPAWPCTDATYVGQTCTQGSVSGQFICIAGPQHEIKGCYNRDSHAYQRVSILPVTNNTPFPTDTPAPLYTSFGDWFGHFRAYLGGGGGVISLSVLEDWRDNAPLP